MHVHRHNVLDWIGAHRLAVGGPGSQFGAVTNEGGFFHDTSDTSGPIQGTIPEPGIGEPILQTAHGGLAAAALQAADDVAAHSAVTASGQSVPLGSDGSFIPAPQPSAHKASATVTVVVAGLVVLAKALRLW